jgi:hypothetical protein
MEAEKRDIVSGARRRRARPIRLSLRAGSERSRTGTQWPERTKEGEKNMRMRPFRLLLSASSGMTFFRFLRFVRLS